MLADVLLWSQKYFARQQFLREMQNKTFKIWAGSSSSGAYNICLVHAVSMK